jgi:hypothetical protein
MSFSLDTPTATSLKAEARLLREEHAKAGTPLSQGAALEAVAHQHGYRDWNTAVAALPERVATPAQVGQRVTGFYLGQPFKGMVLGVQLLADMQHYKVTVKFDEPVNVSPGFTFPNFRHRVMATVNLHGISPSRTSNGEPHMRLVKA